MAVIARFEYDSLTTVSDGDSLMTTKTTRPPSPWQYDLGACRKIDGVSFMPLLDVDDGIVAYVPLPIFSIDGTGPTGNAVLLATAPRVLSVLQELVAELDKLSISTPSFDAATAAIAEATESN